MNARSAPERIFTTQSANQIADLLRHHKPSRLSPSNLPSPEQAKAFPVPADHRRRLDEEERGPPVVPDLAEPGPQEAIGWGEFRPLPRALQNTELMTKGEDFQLQGRTASERGGNRRKERRQERAKRKPKEERQTPTYQVHRSLREPQSRNNHIGER
jgi:hypothetical protein